MGVKGELGDQGAMGEKGQNGERVCSHIAAMHCKHPQSAIVLYI